MSAPGLIEVPTGTAARAVFTTREGGASAGPFASLNLGADGGDDDARTRANRIALCAALGVDPDRVQANRQVHGTAVRAAGGPGHRGRFAGALRGWPEADALTTAEPGTALLVLGADCLPVLLWRRDAPGVAAAHAGWRGLAAGVVEAAVRALGAPGRVGAAVGPGIGPCCYPVSSEVREAFAVRFGDDVVVGDAVDLAGAARAALAAAGVPAEAVHVVPACTACEAERFFSYRRDGVCGRQAGVVWETGAGR